MITTIFDAIAGLPQVLSYVKSIISWITNEVSKAETRKASNDMAKAITDAQATKNTVGMDNQFDPDKKK